MARRLPMLLLVLLVVLVLAAAMGPRPPQDATITFDAAAMGADLDAYLATAEAKVANLKPGAQKEIVWADPAAKARTPFSVVYVHGFSATRMEIHPVTQLVADELGANVFYARLKGHGRDGEAMAEASMNAWVNDIAEAIAIGERIGERVIVVAVSTGATLATWAAAQPALAGKLAAIVMISPNFAIHGASTGLLNMPWAETVLPAVMGRTRSFEPHNEEQAKWWTTSYPSRSVFAMAALLDNVSRINFTAMTVPALFIYSADDKVVVPAVTRKIYGMWGGRKEVVTIAQAGDPSSHVLAGDILSPANNGFVVRTIVDFVRNFL